MNDILDALEEHLDCQRYSNYLAAKCIFHSDSRPSMMIYEDYYRCLSCGAYGRTETLLAKLDNTVLSIPSKPDFKNPWSRWLRNSNIERVLKTSAETLKKQPSLGKYLSGRFISYNTQKMYMIGYREDWYTFPILDSRGTIIGGVARANADTNLTKSKYVIPNGQDSNLLYIPDWNMISTARKVYLTFGIIDALSLVTLGYPAMSTTTGKRIDPAALDFLRKRIVIVPDEGETMEAKKLAKKLGWRGEVLTIDYPAGTKDVNDLYTHDLMSQFIMGVS